MVCHKLSTTSFPSGFFLAIALAAAGSACSSNGGSPGTTGTGGAGSGGAVGTGGGGGASAGSGGTATGSGGRGGSSGGGGAAVRCVPPPGAGSKPDTITMTVNGMPTGFSGGGASAFLEKSVLYPDMLRLHAMAYTETDSYIIIEVNVVPGGMTSGTVTCGPRVNGATPIVIMYIDDCRGSYNWSSPGSVCSATFTEIPTSNAGGRLVGTFSASASGITITDGVIDVDVAAQMTN
jgi:hypothetical protein